MTDISFTSRIKPVTYQDFNNLVTVISKDKFVDYPWTIEDSKLGRDVFTKNIYDCTSCLITNGKEALLMHLSPMQASNHFSYKILEFLKNHIDLKDKNLQGILVGSKNTKKSLDVYNKLSALLKNFNIPFSELKNGKTPTNIAYKSNTDEICISNSTIDKLLKRGNNLNDTLEKSFEKVNISELDDM